jgi:P pilus assembly chaperone PapD
MTLFRFRSAPAAALLATLAAAPHPAPLAAQGVLVAPTSVFIDARSRTASLLLVNPNDQAAEVEIAPLFGYPVTDSAGQLRLFTAEHPDSAEPSATEWIKVFPRRMSIAPRGQQTVRLLVSPPAGARDGEYWSRLVIVARGATLTLTGDSASGGVQIGLPLELRTIIPLFFRKGKLETAVAVSDLRAVREGDSLAVRARIERRGNAAALGTARGELLDGAGKVWGSFSVPVSTYHSVEPRFTVLVAGLAPGAYRLRFEFAAARPDLKPEEVVPFRIARDSLALSIP